MNRRHALVTVMQDNSLPLSMNFASYADGPLPGRLTGASWTIASGKAINTPTFTGNELITDGGLENWASATDLTSWGESIAGTSTVNREGTDKHGGSYAARTDHDGSSSQAQIYQTITLASKTWLWVEYWRKASNGTASGGLSCSAANITDFGWDMGTTWVKRANTGFLTSANPQLFFRVGAAASASLYYDDITAKQITATSLYAYFRANTSLVRVSSNWQTIQACSFAGVIACLDNPASPLNYVVCVHDGKDRVRIIKCVNGDLSLVLNQSNVTFVAGAAVELRHTATNTWQAWYNNSQVSTDQTINDAGIVNNRYHGIFSANGGSQLNSFLALAS